MDKIKSAKSENKRELMLSGRELTELIENNGGKLKSEIFMLKQLNLLRLSKCLLSEIDEKKLSNLVELQSLLLFGNSLSIFPDISQLVNLKNLDLSSNKLTIIESDFTMLPHLANVNLFNNELTTFQVKTTSIKNLNLSKNKLTKFPELPNSLTELNISKNDITDIPEDLCTSIKILDVSDNKISAVPKPFAAIKFKTMNMKGNNLKDKKLSKFIEQNQALKAILDHIQKNGTTSKASEDKKTQDEKANLEAENEMNKIIVQKFDDDFKVEYDASVKDVRGFILCCLVTNLQLSATSFKDFLQYQTKLHDTTCKKRELATIATHDFDLIKCKHLRYAAKNKGDIKIQPLGRPNKTFSGTEYFEILKHEADAIRKEKKRSQVTGVYKFLQLLEDKSEFAFLETDLKVCLSLPPLSNAEVSKISLQTSTMLIEVTSSHSAAICNKIMSELIKKLSEMNHAAGINTLEVRQVKIVNPDGTLKTIYPSKVDLIELESNTLQIIRS